MSYSRQAQFATIKTISSLADSSPGNYWAILTPSAGEKIYIVELRLNYFEESGQASAIVSIVNWDGSYTDLFGDYSSSNGLFFHSRGQRHHFPFNNIFPWFVGTTDGIIIFSHPAETVLSGYVKYFSAP